MLCESFSSFFFDPLAPLKVNEMWRSISYEPRKHFSRRHRQPASFSFYFPFFFMNMCQLSLFVDVLCLACASTLPSRTAERVELIQRRRTGENQRGPRSDNELNQIDCQPHDNHRWKGISITIVDCFHVRWMDPSITSPVALSLSTMTQQQRAPTGKYENDARTERNLSSAWFVCWGQWDAVDKRRLKPFQSMGSAARDTFNKRLGALGNLWGTFSSFFCLFAMLLSLSRTSQCGAQVWQVIGWS